MSDTQEGESVVKTIPPPYKYFHKNIFINLKSHRNVFLLFFGVLYFVSVILFAKEIKIMADSDKNSFAQYMNLVKLFLYFCFGIYLIYCSVTGKSSFSKIIISLIPVSIFIVFAIINFTYLISSSDIKMQSGQAFDISFSTPLHLIVSLFLYVLMQKEDILKDAKNITYLFVSSILFSLIFLHLIDLIIKILNYYTVETVTNEIEKDLILHILVFAILSFGVIYTAFTFYPGKANKSVDKPIQKYSTYFPLLSLVIIYIIFQMGNSFNVNYSVVYISFVYIILITFVLTGTEFLKISDSYISRSLYKINLYYFTSHIRIFNKYKSLQSNIANEEFDSQSKKPVIEFIFAYFRNGIFVSIWLYIFSVIVGLILTLGLYIDPSNYLFGIPFLAKSSLFELFTGKYFNSASYFYKIFFVYFVVFFYYLPVISIVLTFLYEFIEIFLKKYFTTVFFETKEIKE
jgi:hypothetical protein